MFQIYRRSQKRFLFSVKHGSEANEKGPRDHTKGLKAGLDWRWGCWGLNIHTSMPVLIDLPSENCQRQCFPFCYFFDHPYTCFLFDHVLSFILPSSEISHSYMRISQFFIKAILALRFMAPFSEAYFDPANPAHTRLPAFPAVNPSRICMMCPG